jgi:hypothetical protein
MDEYREVAWACRLVHPGKSSDAGPTVGRGPHAHLSPRQCVSRCCQNHTFVRQPKKSMNGDNILSLLTFEMLVPYVRNKLARPSVLFWDLPSSERNQRECTAICPHGGSLARQTHDSRVFAPPQISPEFIMIWPSLDDSAQLEEKPSRRQSCDNETRKQQGWRHH